MRKLLSLLLLTGSLATPTLASAQQRKPAAVAARTSAKPAQRESKRTPTQRLAILPFDHRGSFEKDFLGIDGRAPTKAERAQVRNLKRIVFAALVEAVKSGRVPVEDAAVLVDEQYGRGILNEAGRLGLRTAVSVERSGQKIFDFQYGEKFAQHLDRVKPTFAKVLVRYNPGDAPADRALQIERLKRLSDHLKTTPYQFMFELLVPATTKLEGAALVDYDHNVRPGLIAKAMAELQDGGIEPDVWKIEGVDDPAQEKAIVTQAKRDGRDDVSLIVLGRGENDAQVKKWLDVGARTEGFNGFAVGRTLFKAPLEGYLNRSLTRTQATQKIADAYVDLYQQFEASKGAANK